MEIREKIKAIRLAKKLNKKQFAEKLKIAESYAGEIESGKKEPSNRVLDQIMMKFQVSDSWWESEDGPMFKTGARERFSSEELEILEILRGDSEKYLAAKDILSLRDDQVFELRQAIRSLVKKQVR